MHSNGGGREGENGISPQPNTFPQPCGCILIFCGECRNTYGEDSQVFMNPVTIF